MKTHLLFLKFLQDWINIKAQKITGKETFEYILLICIIISFCASISNSIIGLANELIIFTTITTFTFSILYYISRVKNKHQIALNIFTVYIFVILNVLWLVNGGSQGPTLFILHASIPMFLFFSEIKNKLKIILFFCLNLSALFLVEIHFPQWISQYNNQTERILDLYIISLFFFLVEVPILFVIQKLFNKQSIQTGNSEQVKSDFLENMYHEIKTPMNAIIGFSELLKSSADSDKETKDFYFNIIKDNSNSLMKLMNNIITASKIDAGIINKNTTSVKIKPLLIRLFNTHKNQIPQNKSIILSYEMNENDDLTMNTDEVLLFQIISNLIGNAIKFTDTGHVTFGVKKENSTSEYINFYIADSGSGISTQMKDNIFKNFNTDHFSLKEKKDSETLSVSISYELTKILNGNLEIESKINKGSTFTVRFPFNPSQKYDIGELTKISTPGASFLN